MKKSLFAIAAALLLSMSAGAAEVTYVLRTPGVT